MHNEVQRMIERRNGNNRADRFLCSEGQLVVAGRRQIHRYFNTSIVGNFRRTGFNAINSSCNLDPCVNQRLPPFCSNEHCKFITSAHHNFNSFLKNRNAFVFW